MTSVKMKNKIFRAFFYFIGGLVFIIAILMTVLWIKSPGKAAPIVDKGGNTVGKSISTIEKIEIGDQEQYLIIRGVDSTKPVILFLHGGPGSPEIAFMKKFNTAIEEDFVMVYWEQRGAGKSYSKNVPIESMNLEQFISDTREVTEYLRYRFDQEKLFLMGHSWGSLLGILTAYQYPDKYYAFLGIGQVVHQYRGEQISFDWIKDQALERQDKKAIKSLSGMKMPDSLSESDLWLDFLMKERKYVTKYGGAMRNIKSTWPMIKMVLSTPEYTIADKFNYMQGNLYSIKNMWMEVMASNLFEEIDSMAIPIYFFQGKYDYQTPYSIAYKFYDQLKAHHKQFFTFEQSAHSPIMEEVDKFNSIVKEIGNKY